MSPPPATLTAPLSLSPLASPTRSLHRHTPRVTLPLTLTITKPHHHLHLFRLRPLKSLDNTKETANTSAGEEQSQPQPARPPSEEESTAPVSGVGKEVRKVMEERKTEREGNWWSGVVEEVREVEWPVFGKVLGTTGVVLAIIAGSSVALLTVNVVLAELSDRVFAGRGLQDLFG